MNFKDDFILSNSLMWLKTALVSASGKKERKTVMKMIVSSPEPDTISAIDDLP